MPGGYDAESVVMGLKGTPRLDIGRANMGQLDERRGKTHMLHPDHGDGDA